MEQTLASSLFNSRFKFSKIDFTENPVDQIARGVKSENVGCI
jgi:hypothetical protein